MLNILGKTLMYQSFTFWWYVLCSLTASSLIAHHHSIWCTISNFSGASTRLNHSYNSYCVLKFISTLDHFPVRVVWLDERNIPHEFLCTSTIVAHQSYPEFHKTHLSKNGQNIQALLNCWSSFSICNRIWRQVGIEADSPRWSFVCIHFLMLEGGLETRKAWWKSLLSPTLLLRGWFW